jgi:hypothetical protein
MNRRWRPDQLLGAGCAGRSIPEAAAAGVGRKTGSASRQPAKFTIILVAHVTA